MELYDYHGEYAQRFDGVDKGGGERPADLQKIFQDNKRTVGIRMQQEAAPGILVQGTSTCRQFTSGHKFNLTRHFNADGQFLLTQVEHIANTTIDYRSGESGEYRYQNTFTAMPFAQPFRPQRVTPKPFVQGTQTAYVVGPPGEEIFTDKYGRIKVQFHWDRDGKHNADSSCWIRVTQPWAGKRWGASFWPRIGQEVIVGFMEGDPDQPIMVGTVYNADQMPPYQGQGPDPKHPHDNKLCGVKSNSTPGGEGFNEWRFDDTKGKEQIFVHGERDQDIRIKHDRREFIGNDRHLIVGRDKFEEVRRDRHETVKNNHIEKIEKNMELLVEDDQDIVVEKTKKEKIGRDNHLHVERNQRIHVDGMQDIIVGQDKRESLEASYHLEVGADRNESVGGDQSLEVERDLQESIGRNHFVEVEEEVSLKAGTKYVLEAGSEVSIKGPGGFIKIDQSGIYIKGKMVYINSGGSASSPTEPRPTEPAPALEAEDAKEAEPILPQEADDSKTGKKSVPDSWPGPAPGPTGI